MIAYLNSKPLTTILNLIAPTHFGGAERVVLDLVEAIDRKKFRIVVGAFVNVHFPDNEFIERLKTKKINYNIFWLRRTFDFENIFHLVRLIYKENIHIIHSHGYRSDIMGLIAAKMTRRPIVSTLHGWVPIDTRLKVYEKCDRIALRFFDRILPVSDQMKATLITSRISSRKIIRLHNAVSISTNKKLRQGKATQAANNRRFQVGIIGRLSPEKDVASFLQAARLLSEKYDYLKFLVVGDGPERKRLEALAAKSGLKGKVEFSGFVEDMNPVYRNLDLLVISSKTEGIPLVVLEAMKHGIPVVSTRVGGIPEIVENGVDGILVEPNNANAIADAVKTLLLDANRYSEISRNAVNTIASRFNRSLWIRKIETVYSVLLA